MERQDQKETMLEWALRYMRLGWPVFPCVVRGKEPLVKNGLSEASLNESTIRAWWTKWPRANIGIRTGDRFFAFDVDLKDGGEENYEYLINQHGRFPDTIQQITGTGGTHFLFAMPDFALRNSIGKNGGIAPGIDIRATGGYIVAPPSIHPVTGRPYVWDGLKEIEEETIAAAPEWLLAKLGQIEARRNAPAAGKLTVAPPHQITEGGRNDTLFRLAAALRRRGFNAAEILAAISASNQTRCVPPLDQPELQAIAKSSARYVPDVKGNLFRPRGGPVALENGAAPRDEVPIRAADVEAAVDDVIERNALADAIRLVPEIAKLRRLDRAVIKAKLKQRFGRAFPSREFDKAIEEATPRGIEVVRDEDDAGASSVPPDQVDLARFPHTDSGNGERILALYRSEIRYCTQMKRWLVWDGRRWAVDETGMIWQKTKQMARWLYAQSMGNTALEKHARASESRKAIVNALECAATEPGVSISANELDLHPYLLNCMNGVVDLRSMKLLPHNREFLITKLCPLAFDPLAECPGFTAFVEWTMGANADAEVTPKTRRLVAYLQRAIGYGITGDVGERAVFVCHGGGKNGKSTLLGLIRDVLGLDYSGQLLVETLMTAKNTDATARADLADLKGLRFIAVSEPEQGHKLKEGQLKYLAGGEGMIKACYKYGNPLEFPATHKLFMDCNHLPRIGGTDRAVWDRIRCIPFEARISEEEKDTKLPQRLRREIVGILAWCIRGAAEFLDKGLGEPEEVNQAGDAWKEKDDPLKGFVEDCCELGETHFVTIADLVTAYHLWAEENGERWTLSREAFRTRLVSKGFTERHGRRLGPESKQARTWEGLQLASEMVSRVRSAQKRIPTQSMEF